MSQHVIVSSIYWFNVSAQTKLFIDRVFYGLHGYQGNALNGKPISLLLAYSDTDPYASSAVNALRSFQDIFSYMARILLALFTEVLTAVI